MNQTIAPSRALYQLAGAMALAIALAGLIDALTSNMGAGARANAAVSIAEWFHLFQARPFAAFANLGAINILTISLGIPIYLALARAYRGERPLLPALAAVLFLCGAAIYFSSNSLLALYGLSRQYAVAAGAQKAVLAAAGRALLLQGADLTPGTLAGLLFTQLAGLLVAARMLRGGPFGKWPGRLGLAGYGLMIVFFSLAAFLPQQFETALLFAMPGGLLLTAYQILLARRFFQIGGAA